MIDETLARIENGLHDANGLSAEQRVELQGLLATLKNELATLAKTDPGQAQSVAGHLDLATRANPQPQSVQNSLNDSVAGMEADHPRITGLVNSISMVLSNTGI